MLAVMKTPRIELSLSGDHANIAEVLDFLRSRYIVDVLNCDAEPESDMAVNAFETDFRRGVTPGDIAAGCRLKHGLSQEQLAERTGIGQTVISAYETGKRKLSRRAAIKIGKALNEDPDKFFRFTANKGRRQS